MDPSEDARSGEMKPPMDAPADSPADADDAPVPALDETGMEGLDATSPSPKDEGSGDGAALAELRQEFDALNDRHLRLAAEFNNYRRRVEQERLGLWERAQGDLAGRLLDVLDDLQRVAGLDLGNATVEAIMEGIDLVDRKFERILADAGVEVIAPAGERFDPQTMEAMMRVPAESAEDDERVAMVFQKGYSLKGLLLRPARVSVMKLG